MTAVLWFRKKVLSGHPGSVDPAAEGHLPGNAHTPANSTR